MKIRLNKDAPVNPAAEPPGQDDSSRLKWVFAGAAVIAVIALIAFRWQQHPALPAGAVGFEGSGILLVPGAEWKRAEGVEYARAKNLCPPVLEGFGRFAGSVIEVVASPSFPKDPREMAKTFYLNLRGDSRVMKDSIHAEEFTAPSGLRGIHIWCRIVVQGENRPGEPCVRINYTSSVATDTGAVNQMILSTVAPW